MIGPKARPLDQESTYETLLNDEELMIFRGQPSVIKRVVMNYKDPKAVLLRWKNRYESILADEDFEIFKDQSSVILRAIISNKDPKARLLELVSVS
tara:strand:+ start:165 stop:452 length:288 start_codon:yes stop_codon:yes gene_type:complete